MFCAKDLALSSCIFEVDDDSIISWIVDKTHGSSVYGLCLEQICALENCFRDVPLGSCLKSCNRVAHRLTFAALDNLGDSFWLVEMPFCIRSLVEADKAM
ncbi:hypothetical protein Ddye_026336 [Dipteronia dyeriana]|uniref:RNase H type-1 domain-containing protein n=1 Tax=Dipteronia dyeriana TaxID=168575 RepID=A0AAD9TMI9_9ROSI|nr:hypothetical protein Ddye_026336 [Dipteronia dyeriana]